MMRLVLFVLLSVLVTAPRALAQTVTARPCNNAAAYNDLTSAATDLTTTKYASLQIAWTGFTGTLNATVKLQVSDNSGTSWKDKSGAAVTLSASAGNEVFSLINVTEQFYRVVYLHNGVTGGTVNCYLVAKP